MVFDEPSHTYKVDGIILPSITEICSPITYSKFQVGSAVVEQAAYRGTMVHQMTADYDRGFIDDDYEVETELALYLQAWMNFCHDYQPSWEYAEVQLACNFCAGTVDRIGLIDGKRIIADIKTIQSIDRPAKVSAATQIYGYSLLAGENDIDGINVSDSMIIQLKKDGTYSVYRVGEIEKKYQFHAVDIFDMAFTIHSIAKGDKTIE